MSLVLIHALFVPAFAEKPTHVCSSSRRECIVAAMTRLIPIECVYSGILCGSFTAVLMSKQSVLEGAKMENGKGVANHAVFT